MSFRLPVRQILAVNLGIAVGLIWLRYLSDPATAVPVNNKHQVALALGVALPAALAGLSRWPPGPGVPRQLLFRTALALHAGLMAVLCSTPAVVLAYDAYVHPTKVSPWRMTTLKLAVLPSALMTAAYSAGLLLVLSPRARRGPKP